MSGTIIRSPGGIGFRRQAWSSVSKVLSTAPTSTRPPWPPFRSLAESDSRCAFDARYPGFDQRPARCRLGPRPDLCDRRRCLRRLQHQYHGLRHRRFRNSGVRLGKPLDHACRVDGRWRPPICRDRQLVGAGRVPLYGLWQDQPNRNFQRYESAHINADSSLYRKPPHTRKPGPGRRRLQIQLIRAASGCREILSRACLVSILSKRTKNPASRPGFCCAGRCPCA